MGEQRGQRSDAERKGGSSSISLGSDAWSGGAPNTRERNGRGASPRQNVHNGNRRGSSPRGASPMMASGFAAGGRAKGVNGFVDGSPMRGNMLSSSIMLG